MRDDDRRDALEVSGRKRLHPPEGRADAESVLEGEAKERDAGGIGAVAREEDDARRLQGQERGRPEGGAVVRGGALEGARPGESVRGGAGDEAGEVADLLVPLAPHDERTGGSGEGGGSGVPGRDRDPHAGRGEGGGRATARGVVSRKEPAVAASRARRRSPRASRGPGRPRAVRRRAERAPSGRRR